MSENSPQAASRAASGKLCFVISPIGEPESDTRKKSDQVLKHLIQKVLEPEYKVERSDQLGRPGIITVQIVQKLFEADLVVADLTDRNANVFYELALRHAIRKPAIHIVSRGQQDVPFDVQEMRFVPYDLSDPDALEEARKQLRNSVEAVRREEPVITPVQMVQIFKLVESDEDRNAQMSALFESLNAGVSNLQEGIAEIVQDLRDRKMAAFYGGQGLLTRPASPLGFLGQPASGFNFPSRGSTLAARISAKLADAEAREAEAREQQSDLSHKVAEALGAAKESKEKK